MRISSRVYDDAFPNVFDALLLEIYSSLMLNSHLALFSM